MKKISIIVLTAFIFINAVFAQRPSATEKARWAKHAKQTKIIRDEWGYSAYLWQNGCGCCVWFNVCTMRRKFSADRKEFFRNARSSIRNGRTQKIV